MIEMNTGIPHAIRVLPCVEALITVRPGDDPESVISFWRRLILDALDRSKYVAYNHLDGDSLTTSSRDDLLVPENAFIAACGRKTDREIKWASVRFSDTSDTRTAPEYCCGCSIGWVGTADAPRGISLFVTVPFDFSWERLIALGKRLAEGWPDLWNWMTIGYRFATPCRSAEKLDRERNTVRNLSKRFRAVDVTEDVGLYTSFWQERLRTVSWGTFIGKRLAAQVREHQDVPLSPAPGLQMESIGEALFFQAGVRPVLGDVNISEDAGLYKVVDSMVRSVRADKYVNFLPPWDAKSTSEWLNRWE